MLIFFFLTWAGGNAASVPWQRSRDLLQSQRTAAMTPGDDSLQKYAAVPNKTIYVFVKEKVGRSGGRGRGGGQRGERLERKKDASGPEPTGSKLPLTLQ